MNGNFRKIANTAALMVLLAISSCDRLEVGTGKKDAAHNIVAEKGTTETSFDTVTLAPEAAQMAGISVEAAAMRGMEVEYTFPGKVSVNETRLVHIASRISGRAVEVYANLGDHVVKGKELVLIDSPELGEAQSRFLKVRSSLQVAKHSYERAKLLLDGKVISTGEFQKREGEYSSALADSRAAEDRLHLYGMTNNQVASIEKAQEINSRVSIYSPMEGSIIERSLTMGEVVEPAKSVFTIADLSGLWALAEVQEKDISKIKKGQTVTVTVAAWPEDLFNGKVGYISDTIDPATRTVKVRVEVENKGLKLKPEMFASVKIRSGEKKSILSVPEQSVQTIGGKTVVFAEKTGLSFEKREVGLGPQVDGFFPVLSGLSAGERIVVNGSFPLKAEIMKGKKESR